MEWKDLVALYCTQYNKRPQTVQILEVKEEKFTVKWYDGNRCGKWEVYTYRERRKTVALPISAIIAGKVELTQNGQLSKAYKDKLRKLYHSLDNVVCKKKIKKI